MLVGSGGHEPCEPLGVEVVVLVLFLFFGFWQAFDVGNEGMRVVVVIVIVAVA